MTKFPLVWLRAGVPSRSSAGDRDRTRGNGTEMGQGRVRMGVRERFCAQGCSGTGRTPQGRGHGTKLPEFKEPVDQSDAQSDFWLVLSRARSWTQ